MSKNSALALSILCLLAAQGAAHAQSFANRELRNAAAPDKCVTAPSGASDNTQLVVTACNGSPGQRYTLQGDGHLQAGVRSPQGYELCVDYYPTQGSEGSAVRLFRCRPLGSGIDSHRWAWDGSRLRGAHGSYLAPAGGEAALGAASPPVVMATSPGRSAQWVFDPPPASPPPPPAQPPLATAPGRSITLYSVHAPGKCMAPASGGGLVLWDCVDNPNQRFDLLAEGHVRQGGRCVGHAGDAPRFEECLRNATHQQWTSDGASIRNRNVPPQCLDIERGATANGTRLLVVGCNGSSSQRWSLQAPQMAALQPPTPNIPAPSLPPPGPAPAPQPQPLPGGDVVITGDIGSGPLPAVAELQALAETTVQYTQNLRSLFTGMQRYSSGPNALYDAKLVQQSEAVVNYIQYLVNGPNNPYSLQKLAAGSGGLALNDAQRQLVASLLAGDADVRELRATHQRLASLLRQTSQAALSAPRGMAQRTAASGFKTAPYLSSERIGLAAYRPVVLPSGDLDYPQPRGLGSPPNTTGLDRANNLAATISWGKTLSDTSMFLSYSTQVESQLSSAVDRLAAAVFRSGSVHIGNIGQALKVFSAIKLAVQITNAAVNALAATVPSSISSIYMNLGSRAYQPNAPAWPLAVNAAVDAQVFVVPHAAGGSLVTPLGAVQLVIDAGLGAKFSGAFQRVLRNPEAARKIQESFVSTMRTLGKYHVDAAATYLGNYGGSGGLASWAASVQNSIAIPARELTPIEVNDARLIRIAHGPNIDISPGPNQRFLVKGLTPGPVSLVGSLNSRVPALGTGSPTFKIAIEVTGPPPPGNRCIYAAGTSSIIEGVLINGKCELAR